MVRCVTPLEDYRLCYTVSINQDHLLQVSRRSILDDHQESIDSCLVLAPNSSAMKSQYLEDPSLDAVFKTTTEYMNYSEDVVKRVSSFKISKF